MVNCDDPRGREVARLARRGEEGSLERKLLFRGVLGALPGVGGGGDSAGIGGRGGDSRFRFLGVSIAAAANRSRISITVSSFSSANAVRYDPDTRRGLLDSGADGRLKLSERGKSWSGRGSMRIGAGGRELLGGGTAGGRLEDARGRRPIIELRTWGGVDGGPGWAGGGSMVAAYGW